MKRQHALIATIFYLMKELIMKYSSIALLAVLFSSNVFSQELQEANVMASEAEFVSLDADKDGKLTKQEASIDENFVAQFSAADADLNGEITRMEYILFVTKPTSAGKE